MLAESLNHSCDLLNSNWFSKICIHSSIHTNFFISFNSSSFVIKLRCSMVNVIRCLNFSSNALSESILFHFYFNIPSSFSENERVFLFSFDFPFPQVSWIFLNWIFQKMHASKEIIFDKSIFSPELWLRYFVVYFWGY